MQPLVDIVEFIPVGAIIYHQPRNHYYEVLNKTMMKKDDGGWEYGWSYQEVKQFEETPNGVKHEMPSGEIFSRAFTKFDSDWHLAY